MKTPIYYLEEVKKIKGIRNDSQLAKYLKISRAHISLIKKGNTTIGDELCLKIADILKIDPKEIIAANHYAGTESRKLKKFWESIAASFLGSTLLIKEWINLANEGISTLQCILCKKTNYSKM